MLISTIHSATSLSKSFLAADRIFAYEYFKGNVGQVVREIVPQELSLFELGILADVVHSDCPSYNLLKNQCYWYLLTSSK